jgi:hypothetical protein
MQVLGTAWYLLLIDRYTLCLKSKCRKENSPVKSLLYYLDCDYFNNVDREAWADSTGVFKNCDLLLEADWRVRVILRQKCDLLLEADWRVPLPTEAGLVSLILSC